MPEEEIVDVTPEAVEEAILTPEDEVIEPEADADLPAEDAIDEKPAE